MRSSRPSWTWPLETVPSGACDQAVLEHFDAYMNPSETWFSRTFPDLAGQTIAYFSAEFGLH